MPTSSEWLIFVGTAIVLAVTPGPAMLYVLSRTLHGGRREGVLSALGNAIGDVAHVLAAALGLSALLAASPVTFTLVQVVGAGYLMFLGAQAIVLRRSDKPSPGGMASGGTSGYARSPLVQGVIVESLNPKTALYFVALLPHFVHPERAAAPLVIATLGLIVVATAMVTDIIVAFTASALRGRLPTRSGWQARQRVASGGLMIGLGTYVAVG